MKKEERLRREGMAYALRVAKEKGIEALESDMKARGILELPLAMKSYDGMRELYNMLAMRIVSTIKTTTLGICRITANNADRKLIGAR